MNRQSNDRKYSFGGLYKDMGIIWGHVDLVVDLVIQYTVQYIDINNEIHMFKCVQS